MINIIPFHGIRYNKGVVKDFNLVVTPPYDKIDDKQQEEYYNRSEFNFVRLDKNRDRDKYKSANRHFQKWLENKVLFRDEKPSIYYYIQEYQFEGNKKNRKGFIALLELDEFENGNVLPHEQTLSGPKKDRLDLMIATESTFSQIFMLFSDPHNIIIQALSHIESQQPDITTDDDNGDRHTVWKVDNPDLIKNIQTEMKKKKVYVADGHHRYETSLNYRNMRRKKLDNVTGDELFNYTMCTFINMDDESGISILPTHRFIKNLIDFNLKNFLNQLEKEFNITLIANLEKLSNELNLKRGEHIFGLIAPQEATTNEIPSLYLLTLKDEKSLDDHFPLNYSQDLKRLDVMILHKVILEDLLGINKEKLVQQSNVDYYRDKKEAFQRLQIGEYQLGFLLNSTKMDEVKKVTESGEKMPQKSTDFYPKLLSGLVINYLK